MQRPIHHTSALKIDTFHVCAESNDLQTPRTGQMSKSCSDTPVKTRQASPDTKGSRHRNRTNNRLSAEELDAQFAQEIAAMEDPSVNESWEASLCQQDEEDVVLPKWCIRLSPNVEVWELTTTKLPPHFHQTMQPQAVSGPRC